MGWMRDMLLKYAGQTLFLKSQLLIFSFTPRFATLKLSLLWIRHKHPDTYLHNLDTIFYIKHLIFIIAIKHLIFMNRYLKEMSYFVCVQFSRTLH